MELLQRHLPRVFQAVQSALEYLSTVTSQIFASPTDPPRSSNARSTGDPSMALPEPRHISDSPPPSCGRAGTGGTQVSGNMTPPEDPFDHNLEVGTAHRLENEETPPVSDPEKPNIGQTEITTLRKQDTAWARRDLEYHTHDNEEKQRANPEFVILEKGKWQLRDVEHRTQDEGDIEISFSENQPQISYLNAGLLESMGFPVSNLHCLKYNQEEVVNVECEQPEEKDSPMGDLAATTQTGETHPKTDRRPQPLDIETSEKEVQSTTRTEEDDKQDWVLARLGSDPAPSDKVDKPLRDPDFDPADHGEEDLDEMLQVDPMQEEKEACRTPFCLVRVPERSPWDQEGGTKHEEGDDYQREKDLSVVSGSLERELGKTDQEEERPARERNHFRDCEDDNRNDPEESQTVIDPTDAAEDFLGDVNQSALSGSVSLKDREDLEPAKESIAHPSRSLITCSSTEEEEERSLRVPVQSPTGHDYLSELNQTEESRSLEKEDHSAGEEEGDLVLEAEEAHSGTDEEEKALEAWGSPRETDLTDYENNNGNDQQSDPSYCHVNESQTRIDPWLGAEGLVNKTALTSANESVILASQALERDGGARTTDTSLVNPQESLISSTYTDGEVLSLPESYQSPKERKEEGHVKESDPISNSGSPSKDHLTKEEEIDLGELDPTVRYEEYQIKTDDIEKEIDLFSEFVSITSEDPIQAGKTLMATDLSQGSVNTPDDQVEAAKETIKQIDLSEIGSIATTGEGINVTMGKICVSTETEMITTHHSGSEDNEASELKSLTQADHSEKEERSEMENDLLKSSCGEEDVSLMTDRSLVNLQESLISYPYTDEEVLSLPESYQSPKEIKEEGHVNESDPISDRGSPTKDHLTKEEEIDLGELDPTVRYEEYQIKTDDIETEIDLFSEFVSITSEDPIQAGKTLMATDLSQGSVNTPDDQVEAAKETIKQIDLSEIGSIATPGEGINVTRGKIGVSTETEMITADHSGSEDNEASELKSLTQADHSEKEEKSETENDLLKPSCGEEDVSLMTDQHESESSLIQQEEGNLENVQSLSDQKGSLVGPKILIRDQVHTEVDEEPKPLEEEADLSHSPLDLSAQKSRVLLRRKTSIRKRQGQRQAPPEAEPSVQPPPVFRPRPTGMLLPPQMVSPAVDAPALLHTMPHPAEEQKDEKVAKEEPAVQPKKGIPKHAGFGIPHPKMMQELQARLNKKPKQ
ncbi:uncharacterized protein LOC142486522 isoform X3 [Ascaphus truei]|uniref:uncharacterized protein LOC142486522 isoform X3 n=1 Tax=Ascaphus truei TaxID=8439 RepID=UPI003F590CC6